MRTGHTYWPIIHTLWKTYLMSIVLIYRYHFFPVCSYILKGTSEKKKLFSGIMWSVVVWEFASGEQSLDAKLFIIGSLLWTWIITAANSMRRKWLIKGELMTRPCLLKIDANMAFDYWIILWHLIKWLMLVDFWQAVAASFCFSCPPKVNLNIDSNASKFRKKANKSKNRFSESNPYGRQSDGDDKRQFVRH